MSQKTNGALPLVWAEVDLVQLKKNLKAIRSVLAGPGVEVLAVVKADAYGHGMRAVARTLRQEGVRFFGVATPEEGFELRSVCPKERILVLGSFHAEHIPLYARYRLTPTLSSLEDAKLLDEKLREPLTAHVKIDTGMGRLGVWHENVGPLFKFLKKRAGKIKVEGVYTHFTSADHRDKRTTKDQMRRFNACVRTLRAMGLAPRYLHAANGMGIARFKQSHLNLVRPGILLYGVMPRREGKLVSRLRPILRLKTRIAFLKEVRKGRSLSYGGTYRVTKDTRVATLPIGYSHGFRLGFSNKGFVLIRGRRCPVIGRVTMDQILVDVGRLPKVRRWDEVTLIGRDGPAELSATELAGILGTIPYEIFCAIHPRILRIYKGIRR